jgi:DNA-binding beta-propeller fold protein YncE
MIEPAGVMRLPAGMTGFYPRGAGGLVATADGHVLAMDTQDIVAVSPAGIRTIDALGSRKIAGVEHFLPDGIAVSPDGTIYVDTDRGNGWSNRGAIVALGAGGRVRVLWAG